MEVIVMIVSKLVYNLFRGRNQPTYNRVYFIHLLSPMDIPIVNNSKGSFSFHNGH